MPITFDQIDYFGRVVDAGYAPLPPEERSESMRQSLIGQLTANPLLRRYIQTLHSADHKFRCTLPWHAQGDRLSAAFLALTVPISEGPGSPTQNAVGLSLMITQAQVYLWAEEARKLAWDMPIPRHTIAKNQLPYPIMFFSFETALPLVGELDAETNWFLIAHTPTGINVFIDYSEPGESSEYGSSAEIHVGHIPYDVIYPTAFMEDQVGAVSQVLGMLAFINSPFVDTTPQRLPRAIRRELERTSHPQSEGLDTAVVTLRRRQHGNPDGGEAEGEDREWSSRWWVSGHIRAQWYPSLKAHKLIWIAPYIKGPEDKPVRPKTYMVTR